MNYITHFYTYILHFYNNEYMLNQINQNNQCSFSTRRKLKQKMLKY